MSPNIPAADVAKTGEVSVAKQLTTTTDQIQRHSRPALLNGSVQNQSNTEKDGSVKRTI